MTQRYCSMAGSIAYSVALLLKYSPIFTFLFIDFEAIHDYSSHRSHQSAAQQYPTHRDVYRHCVDCVFNQFCADHGIHWF
jgi:hypothetical protein